MCDVFVLCQPITLAASERLEAKRQQANKKGGKVGGKAPRHSKRRKPVEQDDEHDDTQDDAQDDAHVFDIPAAPAPRGSKREREAGNPELVKKIIEIDSQKEQVHLCCVCCVLCAV
jgi:hypothetical protein